MKRNFRKKISKNDFSPKVPETKLIYNYNKRKLKISYKYNTIEVQRFKNCELPLILKFVNLLEKTK